MTCTICSGKCLIERTPSLFSRKRIATHQPVFTREQLDAYRPTSISGPDTLLYLWQEARSREDWQEADRIKAEGELMGLSVAFAKDHYEAHFTR